MAVSAGNPPRGGGDLAASPACPCLHSDPVLGGPGYPSFPLAWLGERQHLHVHESGSIAQCCSPALSPQTSAPTLQPPGTNPQPSLSGGLGEGSTLCLSFPFSKALLVPRWGWKAGKSCST